MKYRPGAVALRQLAFVSVAALQSSVAACGSSSSSYGGSPGAADAGGLTDSAAPESDEAPAPEGDQAPASQIAAGIEHTCAVRGGALKCWGSNQAGQLGNGTTTPSLSPVVVAGLESGVTAVSAGGSLSCAILDGGAVKCWGFNLWGQLGDGSTTERHRPVDVSGLASGAVAVACGATHACALLSGGKVKCWGANTQGQLGDGTTENRLVPTPVSGLSSGVVSIAAGEWHTCALLDSGGVKCWGRNASGGIGDGTTDDRHAPTDVKGLSRAVAAIAVAESQTCAVLTNGGAKCWGGNEQGQLGDGTRDYRLRPTDVGGLTSGVSAITTGKWHTCALRVAKRVECWGTNVQGELGSGSKSLLETLPVATSAFSGGVRSIAAGSYHTCALLDNGDLACWGSNRSGQLGNGNSKDSRVPVAVVGL